MEKNLQGDDLLRALKLRAGQLQAAAEQSWTVLKRGAALNIAAREQVGSGGCGTGSSDEPARRQDRSMTEVLDRSTSPRQPAGSGVLARVSEQYIAHASKSLLALACALEDEKSIEIDAARVGRVRLMFRKQSTPTGALCLSEIRLEVGRSACNAVHYCVAYVPTSPNARASRIRCATVPSCVAHRSSPVLAALGGASR
jgi:hypothetical protein